MYAMTFVGTPYKWGGEDPTLGYDCSGFVQELLSSVGLDPPKDQTAQGLYNHFQTNGEWNNISAGSLAFFGTSVLHVTHVAMLIDQYRMIEASGAQGKCHVRVRTIKSRNDLVAVIKPRYILLGYRT